MKNNSKNSVIPILVIGVIVASAVFFSGKNIFDAQVSLSANLTTSGSLSNESPVFTVPVSDNGSSSTNPTSVGNDITFTATAKDVNTDQYYLAICKTDAVTAGNDTAPTCEGGSWAITAAGSPVNSDSVATVTHTAATGDSISNAWYGFVCDKISGGGSCYPASGSGDQGLAVGTITFTGVPVDGATVTVDSVTYEFDTANNGITGGNVEVDTSNSQSRGDAAGALVTAEAGANSHMTAKSNVVYVYADTKGVGGNSVGMSKPSSYTGLGLTAGEWRGVGVNSSTKDVYAVLSRVDIYKQTGGTGSFVALGQGARNWNGITVAPNGDVYAAAWGSDIYKQTGGTGSFVGLGQGTLNWYDITVNYSNNDVYAVVYGGDIYKQTGGAGSFVALGVSAKNWGGIGVNPNNNDVYAAVYGGDIWKQTGGTGDFVALNQTSRPWQGIAVNRNTNDVYATGYSNADIYKQSGGTGNFVGIGMTARAWYSIAINQNTNDVYATVLGGDIWKQSGGSTLLSAANLAGGSDANASPFYVDHPGTLGSVTVTDTGDSASIEPGDTLKFKLAQGTITADNNVNMYICSSATTAFDYSANTCTGGTLICSATNVNPTSSDATCQESGNNLVPVPTSHGSKGFKVYVEDVYSLAATGTNSQSYTVADVAPALVSYSTPAPDSLTAGGTTDYTFTVSLTDNNGDNDVTSVKGVFFDKATVTHSCTSNDNNCYITKSDVFVAEYGGDIWKQTGGVGEFVAQGAGTKNWYGVAVNPVTGDVFGAPYYLDIYKQSGGTGEFVAQGAGNKYWDGIAVNPNNNDVYATVFASGSDIYKQTGGTGAFVAQGTGIIKWWGVAVNPATGDVFGAKYDGDIYKQSGGTGAFVAQGAGTKSWSGIAVNPTTGDVYAVVYGGDIWKQTGGTGAFVAQDAGTRNWYGVAVNSSACTLTDVGSGTDNELGASCTVPVWYNANASDWTVEGVATDDTGDHAFTDAVADLTIGAMSALDVPQGSIAYGAVAIGYASSLTTTTIANMGNQILDIILTGTDMCTDSPTCSTSGDLLPIPAAQQKWYHTNTDFNWSAATTAPGPYALVTTSSGYSDADGCLNRDIAVRGSNHTVTTTNESIYWKLKIPDIQPTGTYTGRNTFTVTAGNTCTGGQTY